MPIVISELGPIGSGIVRNKPVPKPLTTDDII